MGSYQSCYIQIYEETLAGGVATRQRGVSALDMPSMSLSVIAQASIYFVVFPSMSFVSQITVSLTALYLTDISEFNQLIVVLPAIDLICFPVVDFVDLHVASFTEYLNTFDFTNVSAVNCTGNKFIIDLFGGGQRVPLPGVDLFTIGVQSIS